MPEPVMEKSEPRIVGTIHQMSRATGALAEALEEGIDVAKRVGKHSSDAAEQLMDDTTERIKRHPAETVVAAFALGFIIGGFIDWITRRK